jgi:outer membrane protein assembly factor BamE (lipoprotein component of BamABCDE complex)
MNKLIYFSIFLFIANCSINKVEKSHGIHFLKEKQKKLIISKTNKNDILVELGPPSTKSVFNNDTWIYIERKTTKKSLFKLGKKYINTNNVLVLEIDNRGLLVKKEFFDINNMKKLKFSENKTAVQYSRNSYIYDFLSSVRQKVNDPLGKRKK